MKNQNNGGHNIVPRIKKDKESDQLKKVIESKDQEV